eukprot:800271-Amphidinium_carterae.1
MKRPVASRRPAKRTAQVVNTEQTNRVVLTQEALTGPKVLSKEVAHKAAALLVGTLPSSTTIYWVDDIHVILQDLAPSPQLSNFQLENMIEVVKRFSLSAPSRTLDGVIRSFVAGLKATRGNGLTQASTDATNMTNIVALNAMIRQTIHASWRAFQIMWHYEVPWHTDAMDVEDAYMITLEGPFTTLVHTLSTNTE